MFGTILAFQTAEAMAAGVFWLRVRRSRIKQILIFGVHHPTSIPVVDSKLSKLAGNPNTMQRLSSERLVKAIRKAVNTKAFEYIITGLLSKNSPMRQKLQQPVIIRIP